MSPPPEFHDLAEAELLNGESQGSPEGPSSWGNLGDWSAAQTYPEACRHLAFRLGQAAKLGPQTRLLDLGFGCGDQISLWTQAFGVEHIQGLNLSRSQTTWAREKLQAQGLGNIASCLHQGNVDGPWPMTVQPNTILALDCVYHFPSRRRFLQQAARRLPAGGLLAWTDLICEAKALQGPRRAVLQGIGAASHIPASNLQSADQVAEDITAAGLQKMHWEDLSPCVMRPFGQWLRRYRRSAYAPQVPVWRWWKYQATASMLQWLEGSQSMRYLLCVARRH